MSRLFHCLGGGVRPEREHGGSKDPSRLALRRKVYTEHIMSATTLADSGPEQFRRCTRGMRVDLVGFEFRDVMKSFSLQASASGMRNLQSSGWYSGLPARRHQATSCSSRVLSALLARCAWFIASIAFRTLAHTRRRIQIGWYVSIADENR